MLASLVLAALLWAPVSPAHAQYVTGYWCANTTFVVNGITYTINGCPTQANPAASPEAACALLTVTPTTPPSLNYLPWRQNGYGAGACQLRSYKLDDYAQNCAVACGTASKGFATVTQSPVTTYVNVAIVFTDAAVQYVNNTLGQTSTAFAAAQATMVNDALASSSAGVRLNVVGTYATSGTCCGLSTNIAQAVAWARDNANILSLRNGSSADMVIVVGNYASDAQGAVYPSAQPALRDAFAGVNVPGTQTDYTFARYFGYLMGLKNQRTGATNPLLDNRDEPGGHGYVVKTGNNGTNCEARFDIMSDGVDKTAVTATTSKYYFPAGGSWGASYKLANGTQFYGPTSTGDYASIVDACAAVPMPSTVQTNYGAWQNTTISTNSTCVFRSYFLGNGTLPPDPTCNTNCGEGTAYVTTHQAPSATTTCMAATGRIPKFSNPAVLSGGTPTGNWNSNAAAALTNNGPTVANFRNTSLP